MIMPYMFAANIQIHSKEANTMNFQQTAANVGCQNKSVDEKADDIALNGRNKRGSRGTDDPP